MQISSIYKPKFAGILIVYLAEDKGASAAGE